MNSRKNLSSSSELDYNNLLAELNRDNVKVGLRWAAGRRASHRERAIVSKVAVFNINIHSRGVVKFCYSSPPLPSPPHLSPDSFPFQ